MSTEVSDFLTPTDSNPPQPVVRITGGVELRRGQARLTRTRRVMRGQ